MISNPNYNYQNIPQDELSELGNTAKQIYHEEAKNSIDPVTKDILKDLIQKCNLSLSLLPETSENSFGNNRNPSARLKPRRERSASHQKSKNILMENYSKMISLIGKEASKFLESKQNSGNSKIFQSKVALSDMAELMKNSLGRVRREAYNELEVDEEVIGLSFEIDYLLGRLAGGLLNYFDAEGSGGNGVVSRTELDQYWMRLLRSGVRNMLTENLGITLTRNNIRDRSLGKIENPPKDDQNKENDKKEEKKEAKMDLIAIGDHDVTTAHEYERVLDQTQRSELYGSSLYNESVEFGIEFIPKIASQIQKIWGKAVARSGIPTLRGMHPTEGSSKTLTSELLITPRQREQGMVFEQLEEAENENQKVFSFQDFIFSIEDISSYKKEQPSPKFHPKESIILCTSKIDSFALVGSYGLFSEYSTKNELIFSPKRYRRTQWAQCVYIDGNYLLYDKKSGTFFKKECLSSKDPAVWRKLALANTHRLLYTMSYYDSDSMLTVTAAPKSINYLAIRIDKGEQAPGSKNLNNLLPVDWDAVPEELFDIHKHHTDILSFTLLKKRRALFLDADFGVYLVQYFLASSKSVLLGRAEAEPLGYEGAARVPGRINLDHDASFAIIPFNSAKRAACLIVLSLSHDQRVEVIERVDLTVYNLKPIRMASQFFSDFWAGGGAQKPSLGKLRHRVDEMARINFTKEFAKNFSKRRSGENGLVSWTQSPSLVAAEQDYTEAQLKSESPWMALGVKDGGGHPVRSHCLLMGSVTESGCSLLVREVKLVQTELLDSSGAKMDRNETLDKGWVGYLAGLSSSSKLWVDKRGSVLKLNFK